MSFIQDKLAQLGTPAPSAEDAVATPVAAPQAPVVDPEMEALRQELAATKKQRASDQVRNAITEAAAKCHIIDPGIAAQLLGQSVRVNDSGAFEIVTDQGTVLLGEDFTPISLDRYVQQWADARPFLVASQVRSGAGSTPSQRLSYAPEPLVSQLFGPGSDSGAANRLALTNKSEYKRLKALAIQKGLIGG